MSARSRGPESDEREATSKGLRPHGEGVARIIYLVLDSALAVSVVMFKIKVIYTLISSSSTLI